MEIKRVTVNVYDARLFYSLVKELKRLKVPLAVEKGEILVSDSGNGDIIIKSRDELPKVIGKILCKIRGKEKFNELTIGIDTNKDNLAIAIVGDGELLDFYKVKNTEAEKIIMKVLDSIPHERAIVNVGIGNSIGLEIYAELKRKFKESVRPIDEYKTSKTKLGFLKDEDITAAYNIALRML